MAEIKTQYKYVRFVEDGDSWLAYSQRSAHPVARIARGIEGHQIIIPLDQDYIEDCLSDIQDFVRQLEKPYA